MVVLQWLPVAEELQHEVLSTGVWGCLWSREIRLITPLPLLAHNDRRTVQCHPPPDTPHSVLLS